MDDEGKVSVKEVHAEQAVTILSEKQGTTIDYVELVNKQSLGAVVCTEFRQAGRQAGRQAHTCLAAVNGPPVSAFPQHCNAIVGPIPLELLVFLIN